MESLLKDLRYACRTFLKERTFALLAVAALAVGIGEATAIYTVMDAVLLRPLPYREPDRLVVALHGSEASAPVSPADFADYQRSATSFDSLGAAQAWSATLGSTDRPERLAGLQVSGNLFDLLGVPAMLGRTLVPGEDLAGRGKLAVLGYGLWQRRFGGDRGVVGRTIMLDGEPFTVVGVMPQSFRFAPFWATRAEIWVPLSLERRRDDRDGRSLRVFGRLRDGVTVAQAQSELSAIAARLERDYPATNTGITITVRPLLDKVVAGIRGTLIALMGMVLFVLLIACANVAGALLARASGRQHEMAVRLALGASPGRVVRQLLTESLLLASLGAALGLGLAAWWISGLLSLLPPGTLPRRYEVALDGRVVLVALGATLVTTVITGLAPALQLARAPLLGAFRGASRGTTDSRDRKRLRSALVTAEVALAIVLLVGAALTAQTMMSLNAVDPGFRGDHVAVADISLAGTAAGAPAARADAYRRIRDRLSAMPGVSSVSAINHLPLAGDLWFMGYTVEGRPAPEAGRGWSAAYRVVQPDYFATMGIRLVAGRDIAWSDDASALPVVVINNAMARRQWPGENAVGQRINLPGPGSVRVPLTVIGVVADVKQGDWTSEAADEVYVPLAQRSTEFGLASLTFVMRTAVDPRTVAAGIAREVAAVDPALPVSRTLTLDDVVRDELWRERLTAQLSAMFAAVALLLAAIGIYAAVAYSVSRRTREFGVRLALGSTTGHVRWLALREGLRPAAVGSALGVVAAAAGARFAERLLYGVAAFDPGALVLSVAVLLAVAAAAAWLPALRATRLDPVAALRE